LDWIKFWIFRNCQLESTKSHLKLSKVLQGRDSWRERSNQNQAEKRKLQDQNRYLKQKIETNIEKMKKLKGTLEKKENQLTEAINQNKKIQTLEKQLEETKKTIEQLKKKDFLPVETTKNVLQLNQINIQVISVYLFYKGVISFRAVPRSLKIFFSYLQTPIKICHFTSVINWCLKLGLYKLKSLEPQVDDWTAIVDASIKWGGKKLLVVLRVPTHIMNERSKALDLKDVEVAGIYVKKVINGEVISELLQPLFSQIGNPTQILSDGGSDIAKGVRLLVESSFNGFQTLDIGHFAANLLKKKYLGYPQFEAFLAFTSKIGTKLRQTIAAWIVPCKHRVKGRFQGLADFAKWAQKAFDYCEQHLSNCDKTTKELIEKNFKGYRFLRSFAEKFLRDTQILNQVLQILKNKGLSQDTLDQALCILSELPTDSSIRQGLETYLQEHFKVFQQHKIFNALISSDIIECLFGKIKYLIEKSSTKDFNKLVLLLPALVGELNDKSIMGAQKAIKIKDIKNWEAQNIGDTILKQKMREFKKLDVTEIVPKPAKDKQLEAA